MQDTKILEEVLLSTTPVSKYKDIDEWYKDFKKQMLKKLKEQKNAKGKRKKRGRTAV